MKYRDNEHDRVLVDLVGQLGFEIKPGFAGR